MPFSISAAGVAGFVWLFKTAMTSSDAYRLAVERAMSDAEVVEALGEPIEPGWFVSGSVQVTGPTGTADIAVPLRGSRASGTLFVVATKSAGEWTFERLELEVEGRRIDLIDSIEPIDRIEAPAGDSP